MSKEIVPHKTSRALARQGLHLPALGGSPTVSEFFFTKRRAHVASVGQFCPGGGSSAPRFACSTIALASGVAKGK